jgi:coenzyme F420-reducing hydrogenase beta subunit
VLGKIVEEKSNHCYKQTDDYLGVIYDLFSAKSGIDGQDGGVVTAVLLKALEQRLFDFAIVTQCSQGYHAYPVVTNKAEDILAARGTKYQKVNVTKKLHELISQDIKHVAIVCTPCEAKVARRIQQTQKGNFQITIVGLFCYEAFNHSKFKKKCNTCFGIDLDKADKIQIRKGKIFLRVNGEEYRSKINEFDLAVEKACNYCDDFAAKNADISVGSVGSRDGYSTVIIRSEMGKNLFVNVKLDREIADKEQIIKLAKFKKERAEKSLLSLKGKAIK